MSAKPGDRLNALKEQLIADKKKTATLGVLSLVLLVVVGRLFLSDTPPAPAGATPPAVTVAPPKDPVTPTIRPEPSGSSSAGGAPRPRIDPPAPRRKAADPARQGMGVRTIARRAVSVEGMERTLPRDPFDTHAWSSFPPAAAPKAGMADATVSGRLWQKLGRVIGQRHEQRKRALDQLEAELAGLELQSTMTGRSPMAYISGRLVREGDIIRGFSVIRIAPRRVTVRKYGLARELAMP